MKLSAEPLNGVTVGANSIFKKIASFVAPLEVNAEEYHCDITIASSYLDTLPDGVYTV